GGAHRIPHAVNADAPGEVPRPVRRYPAVGIDVQETLPGQPVAQGAGVLRVGVRSVGPGDLLRLVQILPGVEGAPVVLAEAPDSPSRQRREVRAVRDDIALRAASAAFRSGSGDALLEGAGQGTCRSGDVL